MQHDASVLAQYANFFRIGHNAAELVLDFCQQYGENDAAPEARVVARIIVTPEGGRELYALLGESLGLQARLGPGRP